MVVFASVPCTGGSWSIITIECRCKLVCLWEAEILGSEKGFTDIITSVG